MSSNNYNQNKGYNKGQRNQGRRNNNNNKNFNISEVMNKMNNGETNKLMENIGNGGSAALLKTNVDIAPIGAIFNLDSRSIEEFVVDYFNCFHIDGVEACGLKIIREGREKPAADLYMFFDMNSDDVIDNLGSVPYQFRRNMNSEGFRPSEKLSKALYPIAKNRDLGTIENKVYVKLNLFKVLGLMLDVNPRNFNIAIIEINKISKQNAILTVVKSENFGTEAPSKSSKIEKLMNRL